MLECVVNVSEGRDTAVLARLAESVSTSLLDVHSDVDHHRTVFTLAGSDSVRDLTRCAVALLDIGVHAGEHPRVGVVDVVPFVPLDDATMDDAVAARNEFARWAGNELGIPCFLYGPIGDGERSLPDVRRHAWRDLLPDTGPHRAHPTAGAICVGARAPLIAYNVLLESADMDLARDIARDIRRPGLRTMAFTVNGNAQVSMNIVDAEAVTIADAFDAVAQRARQRGITNLSAELVGLIPRTALKKVDPERWSQLDIGDDKTIEWRVNRLSK
jgi:glutamate formiminotransferase